MRLASPCGIDLFLQDIDLSLQSPPGQSGIRGDTPGLFDLRLQCFQFLLNPAVFVLDVFIGFTGLGQFSPGNPVFLFHAFQLLPQSCVFQQKNIDIQVLQFLPLAQINSGSLGLTLQGAGLFLQFRQNIVHTHQILFLILQLCLCRSLPALELHDTCGLVKQFPALFRFPAQDLVDLSLTDNGVTFLADTCVIEQFIYIF